MLRMPISKSHTISNKDINPNGKKFLGKNKIRFALSLIGIPLLALVLNTAPAFASTHICNVSGNQLCVGAPTINLGDPVVLTSGGRAIDEVSVGNFQYQLQFSSDTSKCVGIASSGNITVRECSNTNATYWFPEGTGNGNTYWEDTHVGSGSYLASDNTVNDQLKACPGNGCNGWYFNWNN